MPDLEENFVAVVGNHIAGDPANGDVIWTNLSQEEIANQLAELGTPVSVPVVRDLLKTFEFSERRAEKKLSMGSHPDRNAQFENIARLKEEFLEAGLPVISMDTKAKEPLGNFFRAGQLYTTGPIKVYDHDFRSHADALVIPHGLYDVGRNVGHVTLGLSHDTSEFACDSLRTWWRTYGKRCYPDADILLLLCDCGGSNSYRHWIFKEDLGRLVNSIEMPIRVAHYPPYCSRHNPIEHRFFPHVARACRGVIFRTLDVVKRVIRRTSTSTGLRTTLNILHKCYEIGRTASQRFMAKMPILPDDSLPAWNYVALPESLISSMSLA